METVQTPESQAEEYGPEPGARCALKGLEKEFAMLKSRVWKCIMEWIERCLISQAAWELVVIGCS